MPLLALVATCWVSRPEHVVAVTGAALILFATSVTTLSIAYDERHSVEQFRNFGDREPLPRSFQPLIDAPRRTRAPSRLRELLDRVPSHVRDRRANHRSGHAACGPARHPSRVTSSRSPTTRTTRAEGLSMRTWLRVSRRPPSYSHRVSTCRRRTTAVLVEAGYTREDVGAFRIYHKGALSKGQLMALPRARKGLSRTRTCR